MDDRGVPWPRSRGHVLRTQLNMATQVWPCHPKLPPQHPNQPPSGIHTMTHDPARSNPVSSDPAAAIPSRRSFLAGTFAAAAAAATGMVAEVGKQLLARDFGPN